MASNPISDRNSKVRRDIVVRFQPTQASLNSGAQVHLARFLRPVKIRNISIVPDGAGSSPVGTLKFQVSAAEGSSGAIGALSDITAAAGATPTFTAGTRMAVALTNQATGQDVVAGGALVLKEGTTAITAAAWPQLCIHVEYEEDID